jgi:hypothetical protein
MLVAVDMCSLAQLVVTMVTSYLLSQLVVTIVTSYYLSQLVVTIVTSYYLSQLCSFLNHILDLSHVFNSVSDKILIRYIYMTLLSLD